MKKIILISVYVLMVFAVESQETYFTIAPSGLIIREAPSIHSNRIGKLPYGSIVELLEKTDSAYEFIDNEDLIQGVWMKVKFHNFPFIVSEVEEYGYEEEGYVFNKFLEKLNKTTIEHREIDSLKFHELFKPSKPPKTIKITSKKEVEKLLDSKVKWKNVEDFGWTIGEITVDNGQVLKINQKSNDYRFIAYFPTEEILLFEGGHSSDFSISIKTGESLETAGNPEYIVESPNKELRLNGWFPGQECSSYFFQKKAGYYYTYLTDFGWGSEVFGENVCYFNKFCWLNDQEFMYCYTDYFDGNRVEKYFIAQINESLD